LRLRQARDLWVFNCNELKTKELIDGENLEKCGAMLEAWVQHNDYHDNSPAQTMQGLPNGRAQRLPR